MTTRSNEPLRPLVETRAIILGAGRPFRGSLPAAIHDGPNGKSILELQVAIMAENCEVLTYVGGYGLDRVIQRHPDINIIHNQAWRTGGPLKSLLLATKSEKNPCIICYSDIVFSPIIFNALLASDDDTVIIDKNWKVRYQGRPHSEITNAEKAIAAAGCLLQVGTDVSEEDAEGELVGLFKLSPHSLERLHSAFADLGHEATIPDALNWLIRDKVKITAIDCPGQWAELNAPQDFAQFLLQGKASTLYRLRPLIKCAKIEDMVFFPVREWSSDSDEIVSRIQDAFPNQDVVVRSSAANEDGWTSSQAGAFTSVLGVPTTDIVQLKEAVERVIASYDDTESYHHVLIQAQLNNVIAAGVVLTRTPLHGARYYVINWDNSGKTDGVTGGNLADGQVCYLRPRTKVLPPQTPNYFAALQSAIEELIQISGHDALDIEFAITDHEKPTLMQVRPLVSDYSSWHVNDDVIERELSMAQQHYDRLAADKPGREAPVFSVMSDWNPAEMIGATPAKLAESLYRYLITDTTWAKQRVEAGYAKVTPKSLMVSFAGRPYIDVSASLESFVPHAVPTPIRETIVHVGLASLRDAPFLHDKLEFDIALTAASFDNDTDMQRLGLDVLDKTDRIVFVDGLRALVPSFIAQANAFPKALSHLDTFLDDECTPGDMDLRTAIRLIEKCRDYGALPFAHAARLGFVAVALLRSAVSIEAISQSECDVFMAGLNTIATDMQNDAWKVRNGEMTWNDFVSTYGHLRPGTYDISSARYADEPERYLRPMVEGSSPIHDTPAWTCWSNKAYQNLQAALPEAGWESDVDAFTQFLIQSITGREKAKFQFTRALSTTLEAIATWGAAHGYDRDDLSYIDLATIQKIALSDQYVPSDLESLMEHNRQEQLIARTVELPPAILRRGDFKAWQWADDRPNFCTQQVVHAELVKLDGADTMGLSGKIVLIPSADPGWDWIFSQDIAGLITMYGGTNSHMAIRAAEFKLPAAIGVGPIHYDALSKVRWVELNCSQKSIRMHTS